MVGINKKNILFLISILFLLLPIVIADCRQDYLTLEKFYEASKNEDFSAYISLMDTVYIYDHLADEEAYKHYVTAAWEVYDTESYEIKLHKCNDIEEGSIIIFNLKSKLSSDGQVFDLQRDYAAVFERGKIQFVMDLETFSFHQSQAYFVQYYNITKDLVEEGLKRAEDKLIYAESLDESFEVKNSRAWSYFFVIIVIIVLGLIIYFGKKQIMGCLKNCSAKASHMHKSVRHKAGSKKKKDSKE